MTKDDADDAVERGLAAAELFCETRSPDEFRDKVRVTCSRRGNAVTIFEERPPWRPDYGPDWTQLKVAQLRFDDAAGTWSLYSRDSREKWWAYDGVPASTSVDPLLAEINRDPTGIFWG